MDKLKNPNRVEVSLREWRERKGSRGYGKLDKRLKAEQTTHTDEGKGERERKKGGETKSTCRQAGK